MLRFFVVLSATMFASSIYGHNDSLKNILKITQKNSYVSNKNLDISYPNESPLHIKLFNDTLKFSNVNYGNDIIFKIINEKSLNETDLKLINKTYFVNLENNINYILVAIKNGSRLNSIYLTLSKDTLLNNFSIKFKSVNVPIEFEERFSRSFFNNLPQVGNFTVQFSSEESSSDPIYLEVNTDSVFKYNELLDPNKQYLFSSKIIKP